MIPRESLLQRGVYRWIRLNIRIIIVCRIWGRVRIHGRENIPPSGALLVVSNHISGIDPPLLSFTFRRPIHFMAMKELFSNPVAGFLIRAARGFPVQRNCADRAALKRALELLHQGRAVAIYPEGERAFHADLTWPKAGAGYVALKSGVPILPIGMAGTERVMPRTATVAKQRGIDVRVGKVFTIPPELTDRDAVAEMLMERIAELIPEEYRGYRRGPAVSGAPRPPAE